MFRSVHTSSRCAAALVLLTVTLPAQDWPQWRGPSGNGIAPAQTGAAQTSAAQTVAAPAVPLEWSDTKNVKWRTPLAQAGNGSPIVSRGRVFLTMPEDAEGKGRSLLCFDASTGKQLWKRTVAFDRKMPTHSTNPYCSTTPAADGERVIVWHSSAGLHCYDYAGKPLWRRELGEFRHQWGHGTSPVLYRDQVILHSGPGAQSFVASFRRSDGKTVWKVEEPPHLTPEQIAKKRLAGSWCTPLIQRVGDRDLVLCGHPTRIVAYDAADGTRVWWCQGLVSKRGDLTYSSPVVAGEVCMIMGGYVGPSIGVRMDGEGDVTGTHRLWRHPEQMSNCASGVFSDGAIFIPDMGGFVSCIDPKTGATRWRKRVGRGNTWGSIVQVGGRLYLTTQRGTTVVFKAEAEDLVLLAENKIPEPTNATPAIAGGQVFLRTHAALYCIAAPQPGKQAK